MSLIRGIFLCEVENALVDFIHRSGKNGGKHYQNLGNEFDEKNRKLNKLEVQLAEIRNQSLADEINMIEFIDQQIQQIKERQQ
jgi:hypothetical protein